MRHAFLLWSCLIFLLLAGVAGAQSAGTTPFAPFLSSPANAATEVSCSPLLRWHAAAHAAWHVVQYSLDSNFALSTITTDHLAGTTLYLTQLASDTTYYWHVRGDNSNGEGEWSNTWSFTTIQRHGAPALTLALLTPAQGAVNQPTTVTLTWNSVADAVSYQLQVARDGDFANNLLVNLTALPDASNTLSNLATGGHYWWRVRASNGKVTGDWSAAWDFTVNMPGVNIPLTAPALLSPVDGSRTVLAPQLTWNPVVGNYITYSFQVATDPTFTTIVTQQNGLTGTTATLSSLALGTQYYWQVRANSAATHGPWSAVWSFTTTALSALPAPTPLTPNNNAANVTSPTQVSWSTVASATVYSLQVANDAGFTTGVVSQDNLTAASTIVSQSAGATVYWHARAGDGAIWSPWSATFSYTVGAVSPDPPALTAPDDGATVPAAVTLSWAAANSATVYSVEVAWDQTFTAGVISQNNLSGTSVTLNLDFNQQYFWHVRSGNGAVWSIWSPMRGIFTAGPAATPGVPTLTTPANNATAVNVPAAITWGAVTGATRYQVQLSRANDFATFAANQDNVSTTTATIAGLSAATQYFVRVRAGDVNGWGDWTTTQSFTTQ